MSTSSKVLLITHPMSQKVRVIAKNVSGGDLDSVINSVISAFSDDINVIGCSTASELQTLLNICNFLKVEAQLGVPASSDDKITSQQIAVIAATNDVNTFNIANIDLLTTHTEVEAVSLTDINLSTAQSNDDDDSDDVNDGGGDAG